MNLLLGSLNVSESATFAMAWIGQALVYGTLLAGATFLLAKIVGRRVHPAIHSALWLVVLLKFVVPVGPASSLSLASLSNSAVQLWPFGLADAVETSSISDSTLAESGLALEHACDEWALRHGQLTAGQYARCLLEAVSVRSGSRPG